MFGVLNQLKQKGILSINGRNADYVLKYNARKLYPVVDNKFKTKQLAISHDISVPELYAVIENEHQVKDVHKMLENYPDFVVKPACGAGGDGIVVVTGRLKERYRKVNGILMTQGELEYHLSLTLSGAYSLGGHPDTALIEQRVVVDDVFQSISFEGVPDIRVIVLLGYPVMAMVRLPTRQSEGKANLHQGAIGAGVCLSQGVTLGGVHHNDLIELHPDTLNAIAGHQVPYWSDILMIAANAYELSGLGFLGVDIVLDKQNGPMMLELNARPGLNIQIANRSGLRQRFNQIEERAATIKEKAAQRVAFSRAQFKVN